MDKSDESFLKKKYGDEYVIGCQQCRYDLHRCDNCGYPSGHNRECSNCKLEREIEDASK